jgi:hypothetical protein
MIDRRSILMSAALALVVAAAVVVFLSVRARAPASPTADADAAATAPASAPQSATASSPPGLPQLPPPPSWTKLLTADPCPEPCTEGAACAAAGNRACSSGFTCLFGERTEALPEGEHWDMHVSLVLLKKGQTACASSALAGGKICIRPSSSGATTCIPMSEPCSGDGRSTSSVLVTTEDLTRGGMAIDVKSAAGWTAGWRHGPLYAEGLQRAAICLGARIGHFSGGTVDSLTFYLAPTGVALPPRPAASGR